MTYEEFKEIIEMSGEYYVEVIEEHFVQTMIYVSDSDGNTMCKFWKGSTLGIDTIYMDNDEFLKEYSNVIIEFIKTPVKERYPIKKYYVKLEALRFIDEEKAYLNRYTSVFRTTRYVFDTKDAVYKGVGDYETQFTMEEIKEIIPEEDIGKFKFIPVEEEE